jgi:hypothetical protein
MTTNESASQSQLSTDLEMLHARLKGKSLTLDELRQLLNSRGSAMLLILLAFLHAGPGMLRLIGLGIVIAGLGLTLPLPIPFSNSIPAWAVVLLAIGMMENDGLCVLLGHLTAIFSWVFIALTSLCAVAGFQRLIDFF